MPLISAIFAPQKQSTMKSLFDDVVYREVIERLGKLKGDTPSQWGKMDASSMVKHCDLVLSSSLGPAPRKRALMSYLFRKVAKKQYVYRAVYKKNGYTAPNFIVTKGGDLAANREALTKKIDQFRKAGEKEYDNRLHAFFGRLTAEEWGMLQYNHLNHHLTQFGL
jgi:hypothetical protein